MKNIANYISISRIIMSLALVIPETFSVPFYMLYIACGISDMLDGFLARKYKIVSKKGAIIDSMADVIFTLIAVIKILPILDFSKTENVNGFISQNNEENFAEKINEIINNKALYDSVCENVYKDIYINWDSQVSNW